MKKFDKKIVATFRHIRKDQIITIFFHFCKIAVSLILIYNLQQLLDNLIVANKQQVNSIINKMLLLIGFYGILIFIQQYFLRKLFFIGEFSILNFLFGKTLQQNLKFYNQKKSGELLSRITNDSKKISAWLSQGIVLVIVQLIVLVSTLTLLIKYSFLITVILLTLIVLIFLLVKKLTNAVANLTKKDQKIQAEINHFILESLSGIYEIKQLGKEEYFEKRLEKILFDKKFKLNKKIAKIFSFYVGTASVVAFILPIVAVLIAAYLAMNNRLSIGSIIAVYTLTKMIDEPIRSISNFLGVRQIALKIQDNVKDLYQENEIKSNKKLPKLEKLEITIKDFCYGDENKKILCDISFDLKPREIIIIKGVSGSGKTTLANIIQNNIPENSFLNGVIKWNDLRYEDVEKNNLFKSILKTSQEPFVFTGTIRENILLADYYSEESLIEIFDIVGLGEFIKEKGLDYELEEHGKNISGGQRQRIALARVLLRKPELLILDEPTSSLNEELAKKLAKNINHYAEVNDIAIIVIAHNTIFDKYSKEVLILE